MKLNDNFYYPKISVITPSFNQVEYLERTIISIINQNYPNLEYIIIDGGSTDGSLELIKKYEDSIEWWVSEPDSGQANAINKGLRHATGEWVCWQNSDDVFYPGVFHALARAAKRRPNAQLIMGDMVLIDKYDNAIREIRYVKPSYGGLLAEGMVIANQSTFWRRDIHNLIGFLSEDLHFSFDYEWFLRLTKNIRHSVHVRQIWGGLRLHAETKTSLNAHRFAEENHNILNGRDFSKNKKLLYKMRRIYLMLCDGQINYLIMGVIRRLSSLGRIKF